MARRLILDTTVLIDLERDKVDWEDLVADNDDVAIAAVTAAELLVGVELADPSRQERRRRFVIDLLGAVETVSYTLDVARHHAELLAHVRRSGTPRGAHDLIIAATARSTERILLTSDEAAQFGGLPGVNALTV